MSNVIIEVSSYPIFKIEAQVQKINESGKSLILTTSDNLLHTGFIPDKEGVKYSHKNWTITVNAAEAQRDAKWNALKEGATYNFYVSMRMDVVGSSSAVIKY